MGKPIGGIVVLEDLPVDLMTGINFAGTVTDDPATVHSLVVRAGTANSGDIFIGGSLVNGQNDTWMVLEAGDGLGFDLPAGDYIDLRNIFALAAATTVDDQLYVFGIQ